MHNTQKHIPQFVLKCRTDYWTKNRVLYSGQLHLLFTNVISLCVIYYALTHFDHPSWKELLTIPITLFYGNCVEYYGHRGPMHKKTRLLEVLFNRHTVQHHRFFTHQAMSYSTLKDLRIVLFPPTLILFFVGGFVLPISALLSVLATKNIALFFMLTASVYYLSYEWLHLYYHTPKPLFADKIPGLKSLKKAHTIHHNPALMNKVNFNLTYPFMDWINKTRSY